MSSLSRANPRAGRDMSQPSTVTYQGPVACRTARSFFIDVGGRPSEPASTLGAGRRSLVIVLRRKGDCGGVTRDGEPPIHPRVPQVQGPNLPPCGRPASMSVASYEIARTTPQREHDEVRGSTAAVSVEASDLAAQAARPAPRSVRPASGLLLLACRYCSDRMSGRRPFRVERGRDL
jgi:hypothetical protein